MSAPSGTPVRPAAPQLRLVVAAGSELRHVALRSDVVLGDALRAALLPVDAPGTLVLGATGTRLDPHAPAGEQLQDGATVHVVRPAPAPDRELAAGAAGRRPPPQAGLFAIVGALGVVLTVVALVPSAGPEPDALVLAALVCVLALCAAGLALARVPAARAATLASPALAAAAGAWAMLPATPAQRRLALVVALVSATVAACVRAVVTHLDRSGDDEAVVVLAALSLLGATQGAALLLGRPALGAAAFVVGLCPLVLRLAPRFSLVVPDDQLLDISHASRTAGSVRAPRPRPLGRLAGPAVRRSVDGAEARATAAVVAACLLAVVLLGPVLAAAEPGTVPAWGAVALAVCVVVAFTLVPRTTRGTVTRWWPRAAAGAAVVELAVLGPLPAAGDVAAALVALVLAVVVALVGAALGRSWRSVVASRFGDALEGLALVLSLPAAVVAADLVDTLRKVTS
ncbi:hypothetical protein [Cellulomonas composti]|uniref:EccD-like transmembrane domain-containing protein n=1 Tax=Cellulomonas composti TaxID=266130 RepID=A0A511JEA1_9CELL|nr:hypothetical protein [Cellulomonas composti]GEL96314.1 hypothetical protein CCO02nite_29720 [Cellulomonas composti]